MGSLVQKLHEARVKNIESRYFIPDNALETCLSREAVHECIQSTSIEVYHRREIEDAVMNGGKRMFGILVILGEESSIRSFIERDQLVQTYKLDSKLPIAIEDLRKIYPTGATASLFHEKQWEVLAPFFREDKSHRIFDQDTVFPFVGLEVLPKGGFGEISKVELDEAHHGFSAATGGKVTSKNSVVG